MKPFHLLLAAFLLAFQWVGAQNINFPDANFKQALIDDGVDTGMDGEISETEAEAVTLLNVAYENISDLTGIKYFINLQSLYCHYNSLTSLDLSGLTSLEGLRCYNNALTSLNVSGLTSLEYLYCYDNSLTSLDLSGLTSLQSLYCLNNSLTSLNVSGLTSLEGLQCYNNALTSLNVSGLTNLSALYCQDNSLTSLNTSGLTSLQFLNCQNNSLTSLNASGLTSLQEIDCRDNFLTSVDLRSTPVLNFFDARENPDLQCLIVDNLSSTPATVLTDQTPPPFTTEPCLATFEGLPILVQGAGLPAAIQTIINATLRLAEESCSLGSKEVSLATLGSAILMVYRSEHQGRLSTRQADELVESINIVIEDIKNGTVDCSREEKNIIDWFDSWFSLENGPDTDVSNPQGTATATTLYPNPTSGRVNFSQPDQQVVVYNMLGKVMEKAEGVNHVDLSDYQPGVYVIQLAKGGNRTMHQVVKQ